jgi:hypothetical protein
VEKIAHSLWMCKKVKFPLFVSRKFEFCGKYFHSKNGCPRPRTDKSRPRSKISHRKVFLWNLKGKTFANERYREKSDGHRKHERTVRPSPVLEQKAMEQKAMDKEAMLVQQKSGLGKSQKINSMVWKKAHRNCLVRSFEANYPQKMMQ